MPTSRRLTGTSGHPGCVKRERLTCPAGTRNPTSTMRGMSAPHVRRPRYPGRNPRRFQDKYKELNPDRYASEVQKVVASGRTPAGMHRPIMVDEVLSALRPSGGRHRGGLHARRRRSRAGDPATRAARRTPDRARRRSDRAAAHRGASSRRGLRPRRVRHPSSQLRRSAAGAGRRRHSGGGRDSGGPRRVVDAARQPRARLHLQGRGPARHAHEPVARRAGVGADRAPERGEAPCAARGERGRAARGDRRQRC